MTATIVYWVCCTLVVAGGVYVFYAVRQLREVG